MGYVNGYITYRRACNLNGLKFDNGIQDLLLNIYLSLEMSFKLSYFIEYIILKQYTQHTTHNTQYTIHTHEKYIFNCISYSNEHETSVCQFQTEAKYSHIVAIEAMDYIAIYDTEHGSRYNEHWTWIFRTTFVISSSFQLFFSPSPQFYSILYCFMFSQRKCLLMLFPMIFLFMHQSRWWVNSA